MDSFGMDKMLVEEFLGDGGRESLCRVFSTLRLPLGSSYAACGEVDGLNVSLLGLLHWMPRCVEQKAVWGSVISTFSGVWYWCEGFD